MVFIGLAPKWTVLIRPHLICDLPSAQLYGANKSERSTHDALDLGNKAARNHMNKSVNIRIMINAGWNICCILMCVFKMRTYKS